MLTAPTVAHPNLSPYTKTPGMEPIPGYVLLAPLGRGGFGEVWKCEAPGGLHKAVKFVAGSCEDGPDNRNEQLRLEFEAVQQVKAIRHPYLLCLERVELVENELVMVMGLADRQLGDRLQECKRAGLPGIPRAELLEYLKEAAEALDVIGTQYGLQHLDVKPANLFLTAGHVQVGDYGLVSKLDGGSASGKNRGITPKYSAPEVLRGQVHTRSDQYSLAVVYQELLTGTFPFPGRTPQQYMMQHSSGIPDLGSLPEQDRAHITKALAKQPDDRFPSCRAFVAALANTTPSKLTLVIPRAKDATTSADPARNLLITPAPRLQTPRPAAPPQAPEPPKPEPASTPAPVAQEKPKYAHGVVLPAILSVLPVEWLRGREAPEPDLPPHDMIRALLSAANRAKNSPTGGEDGNGDPTWACRFLTTMDPRVAKVKLNLLWEQGGLTSMDGRQPNRVIFKLEAPAPEAPAGLLASFGKKAPPPPPAGLEVLVELPEPGLAIGEVSAQGRLFGSPPAEFAQSAGKVIVSLLEGVQKHLNNFNDRRKHPRVRADFPVMVYPMHHDGRVETPLSGKCQDVSVGGIALRLASSPGTKYVYVAFEGVRGTTGLALLVQVKRVNRDENGVLVTGRYRLELWPPAPES